jgi:nicotinate-nucleotide adenylyltransferase
MKLGILGGTFNPPHIGHLILAQVAQEQLDLDKVLFIPANQPPHKQEIKEGADLRLEMLKVAVEDNQDFEVIDWEIKRGGASFTVETLRQLGQRYPEAKLFLIIGSDLANNFQTWQDYQQILELATVVVAQRPGQPLESSLNFKKIDMIDIGINSSDIRRRIRDNLSIRYWIPQKLYKYFEDKEIFKFYRFKEDNDD